MKGERGEGQDVVDEGEGMKGGSCKKRDDGESDDENGLFLSLQLSLSLSFSLSHFFCSFLEDKYHPEMHYDPTFTLIQTLFLSFILRLQFMRNELHGGKRPKIFLF